MGGMKMPVKYVCEMFIDRVSASKNYQKDAYTDRSPLDYYNHGREHYMIHPDTKALLEYMLTMLAVRGEDATYSFVKKEILKGKIPYEKQVLDERTAELLAQEG